MAKVVLACELELNSWEWLDGTSVATNKDYLVENIGIHKFPLSP